MLCNKITLQGTIFSEIKILNMLAHAEDSNELACCTVVVAAVLNSTDTRITMHRFMTSVLPLHSY